jgi:hypothetical protein
MEPIISVCGDVCSECPRYNATINISIEELQNVALLWHRLGFRDRVVDIEEIKCSGCNKKPDCGYGLTTCEHLTDKANCGECELFPCSKFDEVFTRSDKGDEICKLHCNADEYSVLKRAFFNKKEILTNIHHAKFKQ